MASGTKHESARPAGLARPAGGHRNALATSILAFLLWDVITKAAEPIDTALTGAPRRLLR